MTEIAGGEQFARGLRAEGIEFLFELPSPEVDPLLAELESHGIRQVRGGGRGREGGRGSDPAPGSANLPSGMVTAYTRTYRCSSSPHNTAWRRLPLAAVEVSGPGPARSPTPGGEVGRPAFGWRRIPVVLRLACEMWNGRPGPVHVELPALVLYPTEDDETAPVTPPAAYGGTTRQASDAGSELPVVVLRLRGRTTLGATAFIVLANYAQRIRAAGGHLFLSGLGPDLLEQLHHAHRVDLQDAEESGSPLHACSPASPGPVALDDRSV